MIVAVVVAAAMNFITGTAAQEDTSRCLLETVIPNCRDWVFPFNVLLDVGRVAACSRGSRNNTPASAGVACAGKVALWRRVRHQPNGRSGGGGSSSSNRDEDLAAPVAGRLLCDRVCPDADH